MKLFKLSKLLIETPSSWMVPRVPASSLPRSLLWYFLSDFWPTILRTNTFKGLLKIYFSLRNNVYLVSFLHVLLFVWRLCRIENVFWESLTCHKCFPSRNSKFRASKNRFYCVFPSQNSCKKEVFTRGYFKAAIRLIVSEHSSSSLSRPTKIKLSEDISKKCRVWGGRILCMEFLPNFYNFCLFIY